MADFPRFGYQHGLTEPFSGRKPVRYKASIPPAIADVSLSAVPETEDEKTAIRYLRSVAKSISWSSALEGILLRAEAVNSSRIEGFETAAEDLMLAEIGSDASEAAQETFRNIQALKKALTVRFPISPDAVKHIHAILMAGSGEPAGVFRDQQGWIARSKHAPITSAKYIPPEYESIAEHMADLCDFMRREDLPLLSQIAIFHAQFESIHPFGDGNGRTGRCLIQTQLAHHGFPSVPVSAALYADTSAYYETFTAYQNGNPEPACRLFAHAVAAAASAVGDMERAVEETVLRWQSDIKKHRMSAAATRATEWIAANPVFTCQMLAENTRCDYETARKLVRQFADSEIVSPAGKKSGTGRGRDRKVWAAKEIGWIADETMHAIAAAM